MLTGKYDRKFQERILVQAHKMGLIFDTGASREQLKDEVRKVVQQVIFGDRKRAKKSKSSRAGSQHESSNR